MLERGYHRSELQNEPKQLPYYSKNIFPLFFLVYFLGYGYKKQEGRWEGLRCKEKTQVRERQMQIKEIGMYQMPPLPVTSSNLLALLLSLLISGTVGTRTEGQALQDLKPLI